MFSIASSADRWSATFVLGSRRGVELRRRRTGRAPPAIASIIRPACAAGAAVLVDHDVRVLLGDEHVARSRVQLERDLVRHRRRRDEERGLVAEERRGPLLQRG